MEIATNAVLAAMLIQATQFAKDLSLPLQTPLEASNVVAFRTFVSWHQADSDLSCYLAYRGGYEFRLSHGYIIYFDTREAYLDIQDPAELRNFVGEVRFTQAQCFAKVKEVFHNLGYTNVPLLDAPPEVRGPIRVQAGSVPRFIFRWPEPPPSNFTAAEVEVNATDLNIEWLQLANRAFWRKPWPITFGTTNTLEQALGKPPPSGPKRTDLEVRDMSRPYALAYLKAVLPTISGFCSKLGSPFPQQVSMEDISMGESEVAIKHGRVSVSLRLKSGYGVVFTAGHVWAVHAPDAYYTSPWWREEVRQSREYLDPVQFSAEQAAEKVRHLLVDSVGLDEKLLWLDTEPVFSLRVNAAATNGIRRYVFQWQLPETAEARDQHRRDRILSRISVSAEVDAVSGRIKTLNFFHPSLERPDPQVDVPMQAKESENGPSQQPVRAQ